MAPCGAFICKIDNILILQTRSINMNKSQALETIEKLIHDHSDLLSPEPTGYVNGLKEALFIFKKVDEI